MRRIAGKKIKGRGGIKSKAAQLYTPLHLKEIHSCLAGVFSQVFHFKDAAESLILGNGKNDDVTMGPLINEKAVNDVIDFIEDAKRREPTY